MYEEILKEMIKAGKEASAKVFEIYKKGFHVEIKSDASPVTDADLASDKIIRSHLGKFEDIAWLCEEDSDDLSRLDKSLVFIVDPLDGTADFVKKDDSFGINIALVKDHHPLLSVIMVPAKHSYAYAIKGKGSYYVDENGVETRLHVSDRTKDLILLESMSHVEESEKAVYVRHADLIKKVVKSGASTKSILLASGKADASVRYTPSTKEWDVCAPELVVTEAGGIFVDSEGVPFEYNRRNVYNEKGYSMFNRKENMILLK
jgi:3'(2'), 5'-bisphosphate nucleotidase